MRPVLALLVAALAGVWLTLQDGRAASAGPAACTQGHWEAPPRAETPVALADAGRSSGQPHACTTAVSVRRAPAQPFGALTATSVVALEPPHPHFRRFPLLI